MQAQILRDGEVGALREFLMDEADAGVKGGVERAGREYLAIDDDGAAVLAVEARDDLAQRALASAVLTHQRVDLASPEGDGDVVERLRDAEALADVGGGEEVAHG